MRYKAALIKPFPDVPSMEGIMPRPMERYSNSLTSLREEMTSHLEGAPAGSEAVVYEVCFMERERLAKAVEAASA